MKKVFAEFLGTCFITFIGCSVIVFMSAFGVKNYDAVLPVALTFGLGLAGTYYAIGNISGAHVNPAVSLAVYLSGDKNFSASDLLTYLIAQLLGAVVGVAILGFVIMQCDLGGIASAGLAASYYGSSSGGVSINIIGAVVIELVLTFIFVLITLSAYNSANSKQNTGFVIGIAFATCYILSYLLMGGSLNPAKSLASASVLFVFGSTKAMEQVLLFVVAPLIGAAFSALVYSFLNGKGQKVEIVKPELPELSKKEESAPKPASVKKSATKAKPTTPSRIEKADEKTKRKGFFSGEPRVKSTRPASKETKAENKETK